MRLHEFFRSSTSIRVRCALKLKGVAYEHRGYRLRDGEQRAPAYLALNPQGLVPGLELPDGTVLTQSLAIIEWLDEVYPEPALLPADASGRARVRSLAQVIALDVHPLNNLRVLQYLQTQHALDEPARAHWFRHWASTGLAALEQRLSSEPATGKLCHGNSPTIADLCLYAQVLNSRRFEVPMAPYPTIRRIFEHCAGIDAFADSAPERQPDAVG